MASLEKAVIFVRAMLFSLAGNKAVLIMLGGAIGSYLRYLVGNWVGDHGGFPLGTFLINVSGSFILAAATLVLVERLPEYRDWNLLIGTGFCGGFTTFSTFEWETYKLVRDASWFLVLANVLGSVLAGFVGILLAVLIVNLIFPKR
jgi:CrcB protein